MEVFFVKRKFSKKVISILLVFAMLIGGACFSCTSAAAFDLGYISVVTFSPPSHTPSILL